MKPNTTSVTTQAKPADPAVQGKSHGAKVGGVPRRTLEDWERDVMANLDRMSRDPAYRDEVMKRQS